MLKAVVILFWVCLGLISYTYFLYAILLFLAYSTVGVIRDVRYLLQRRTRRTPSQEAAKLPGVSLIIPAFNEETSLPDKIENLRQMNYPDSKLEIIFVSDGSTDRTNEILRSVRDPRYRILFVTERKGKPNALNVGVPTATTDILVFTDASTLFAPDAIPKLVRHFVNPSVGVVCGSQQLRGNAESQQTEGVYWKYEGMLRLMEARLGATLTADGCIYALRRQVFQPLSSGDLIDDFLVPMGARRLGYSVVYDPEALAYEVPSASIRGQFVRRVRIAMGSFRALPRVPWLALPLPTLWAFLSHKLLRWIVPFLLIGLFASNAFVIGEPFYRAFFVAQLIFYTWAAAGCFFQHQMSRVRFASIGYFLLAMNLAFLVGFFRSFRYGGDTWRRVH